jgi:hypothetical protein
MVQFPIGERFAVICVTAAIWGPRTTFAVLLAWGALALAYVLTGRARATLRGATVDVPLLDRYRDGLPPRIRGAFAWASVPLERALEYGAVLAAAAVLGPSYHPAAFVVLCALAARHYNLVYRNKETT